MRMWGWVANEHFRMTSIRVSMMYLGAADVRSVDLTWLDGVWGELLWVGRALFFTGDGVQLTIGCETDRA
jgi:hypothetical protein